jgi:hypothetical protein
MTSLRIVKPVPKNSARESIGPANTLSVITVDGSPVACVVEKRAVASVLTKISNTYKLDPSRIKVTETPII